MNLDLEQHSGASETDADERDPETAAVQEPRGQGSQAWSDLLESLQRVDFF